MTLETNDLRDLGIGAVVLAYDPRSLDWSVWQKYDDVHQLRDETGDYAADAWSSPAYMAEHSDAELADISKGRIAVLWDAVTPPA
jgi:hypothetical protein